MHVNIQQKNEKCTCISKQCIFLILLYNVFVVFVLCRYGFIMIRTEGVLPKPSFSLGNSEVNSNLECPSVFFIPWTWLVTSRTSGPMARCRSRHCSTETHRDGGGGVITAQPSYSESNHAGCPIAMHWEIRGATVATHRQSNFSISYSICQH